MTFIQKLNAGIVLLDGAMGTQLQAMGLKSGEYPEDMNISRPADITAVHAAYLDAGCDVVYTNTFGANCLKFGDRTEDIVHAAVACARAAVNGKKDKYIALDVGPTGKLLKPLGELGFEDAVSVFKRTIAAGVQAGVDLIAIETMNDAYELKAAVVAAKEVCDLPVIATMVFGEDGKTMTGCSPEAAVALLEGLGVCALGVNCSLAPDMMTDTVSRMLAVSSTPVIVKPNAGIPVERNGRAVYDVSPAKFARDMKKLLSRGVRVVGGCCGTTPEYIAELKRLCVGAKPVKQKNMTVISSYSRAVTFGGAPVMIGERINPTGKKKLKQALKDGDIGYILNEAVAQAERGAMALDVNVGLPELDEPAVLCECVREIQAVTDLPLQIDTSDPVAMERAMRIYNGKPLVNSVNGRRESMDAIFPLVKKYGGAVICLTLDENGIPSDAKGRVEIAKRIISVAAEYGIKKCDLIFDTLATAISADIGAANASLRALGEIRHKLGCHTSLGVSNVSFGLPQRDFITSTYFTLALGAGLSAAIYNPYSTELEKAYRSYMALAGMDDACAGYIDFASSLTVGETVRVGVPQKAEGQRTLRYCVEKGLKADAAAATRELLDTVPPLDVINGEVIPALDAVGVGFENKTVFLPQLLMSAEAAGAAFEEIKSRLSPSDSAKKTKIVIATVKGDIHDIGKNIVTMLLRNYGFTVIDLGRDVPPDAVVAAVKKHGAKIAALSALMTTTVVSMKETVELLKRECPDVLTCVGGAVLTQEYADAIGADRYCKDAMDTVRYAESVEAALK